MNSSRDSSNIIKAVIFDLDGTLVDAYRAVWISLNAAFQENNLPKVTLSTVKRSVGWGEKVLVKKFVPPDKVDSVLKVYRASHRKALKNGVKFLPGARALIIGLKKNGYKIAIASNRPTEFCEMILKILNIRSYFDIVLCADKVKHPKPAGDILKKILKQWSLKPQEAFYIGDMAIDVETGRNAKVKTIAVTTGSSTKNEIVREKPFKIVKNLSMINKNLSC